LLVAAPPHAPANFTEALEYVLPKVWNESQNRVRFTSVDCHKAGTQNAESVWVCNAEYRVLSNGRKELWRIVVTGYGQVNSSKRLK
jgi:hypothetical protein